MLKAYAHFFCTLHMLFAYAMCMGGGGVGGWGVYMQIAYAKRTFGVEFFSQSQKP